MTIVKCDYCGKEFKKYDYRIRMSKNNFCCVKCSSAFKKGKSNFKIKLYNKIEVFDNYAEIIIESPKYGILKTKIDVEDVEKVKPYRWIAHFDPRLNWFYIVTGKTINSKPISLHRFVTDCPSDKEIDHRDRDTLNNMKSNLRICEDNFLNRQNQGIRKDNKTGYKNIIYNKINKNYRIRIKRDKKVILDMSCETLEKAVMERNKFYEVKGLSKTDTK